MTNYPNIDDVRFIVKLLNQRCDEDDIRISNEGQLKLLLEKPQMTLYGHTRYQELHQKIAVLMEGLTRTCARQQKQEMCDDGCPVYGTAK